MDFSRILLPGAGPEGGAEEILLSWKSSRFNEGVGWARPTKMAGGGARPTSLAILFEKLFA
jgi:hypothetical protein